MLTYFGSCCALLTEVIGERDYCWLLLFKPIIITVIYKDGDYDALA
jgi:hypothetical protein